MTDPISNNVINPSVGESDTSLQYCVKHSRRATNLRCNRCNDLICSECANKTPVGYRCHLCIMSQQSIFETVFWYDYFIVGLLSFVLTILAMWIMKGVGWLMLFVAPVFGGIMSDIIGRSIKRRRGKNLSFVAVGFMGLASIVGWDLWGLIFVIISANTVYSRLKGINI